jgi:ActR/RegA family two-component response regulator
MPDATTPKQLGTVLLISQDPIANRQITDAMRQLALTVEACVAVPAAAERLSRRKFDAVVVDLSLGGDATVCLEQVRSFPSNRTAVIFALTGGSQETARALKFGASFVLQRPLTQDSIRHTLKVAYGLILRERRRYFRYPITVPAVLIRKGEPEIFGRTVDVSERGMAFSARTALAPGSEGRTEFTLPSPPLQITAEARVCWNNEKGEAGLSFLFLPFDLASGLQTWLAKKLEEQLPQAVTQRFNV